MERKWAAVAFGDIRGFGAWTYRALNSREIKEPFIMGFGEILGDYVKRYPKFHFKYLGDGMMVLREFTEAEKSNGVLLKFILTLQEMTRKILGLISSCEYPRPDGFRIRIAGGSVYKLMVPDPVDPKRQKSVPEYVEYTVNMAQRLLKVNPEIICLCTENIGEAVKKKRSILRVRDHRKPSHYPSGVNREDIDGLKILSF